MVSAGKGSGVSGAGGELSSAFGASGCGIASGGGGSGRQNFVGDVVVVLVDGARVCCYCNRRTNAQYEEIDSHGKTALSKN